MWRSTAIISNTKVRGNCLGRAKRGRHIVFFGGSQLGGSNTGQFGSLDLTPFGAPDNNIPAGVTVIVNGATKVSYDAVHGIEPGLAEAAREAGETTGLTILSRIVGSTIAQDWITTNFATVVTDVTNAGLTPCLVIYAMGGGDGASVSTLNSSATAQRILRAKVKAAWPGCGYMVSGLMSTDLVSFPQQPALRTQGQTIYGDAVDEQQQYFPPNDFEQYMQTDVTHLTSAGLVRFGIALYNEGRRGGITR